MQLPITILIDRTPRVAQLLCRGDIVALTLLADGNIKAKRRDGTLGEAHIVSSVIVFTGLVVLRLRTRDRIESLVLPHAATGTEAHRRLRVWLRWRAQH